MRSRHTLKGDANMIVDLESRWLEFFRGVPLAIIQGGAEARTPSFHSALPRSERVQLARASSRSAYATRVR